MEVVGFVTSCLLWKSWKLKQQQDHDQGEGEGNITHTSSDVSKMSAYETLIGSTPLVKLRKASQLTGCDIMVKMENMNPGKLRRLP
jgi:hypothetical protein